MLMFGIGWFLSVGWLILSVQITENYCINDKSRQKVQGLMISLWIFFGLVSIIFFR